MSIVAPNQRRLVWPVALALTSSMLVALVLYLPTREAESPGVGRPGSIAAPGVTQASWDVRTFPAGGRGVGKLSKAAQKRLAAQRAPLVTMVKDVYDSLFLEPARLREVLRGHFTVAAATRAKAAGIGLSERIDEVQIKRRMSRIGIHVQGASRAAARVVVVGKATSGSRRTKFRHEATLWMERTRRTWKIIAFDVSQGPA